MKTRRQTQIAKLFQLREQKERLAQYRYKGEVDELSALRRKTLAKETITDELKRDLYSSLETRLHSETIIADPGARFTTFVMSTNAAREHLLVQESLVEELRGELEVKREIVSEKHDDLIAARTHLEKIREYSSIVEREDRISSNQNDDAEVDEITAILSSFKY